MYQLYYSTGACSLAVHTMLNEVGVPFTLQKINIMDGEQRKPDYIKINRFRAVPSLVLEDGSVMTEVSAILIYLAEKYKSPLLPTEGDARRHALRWNSFASATLHPAYARGMWSLAFAKVDEDAKSNLVGQCADTVQWMWDNIEKHLEENNFSYLAGNEPTLGDFLTTVVANWGFLKRNFERGSRTKSLLKNISNRPAFKKALEAEGVEYKVTF